MIEHVSDFELTNDISLHAWVNNREAGDLIRHRAHYDVIVMISHLALTSELQKI